ncbi:MAG: DUF488 domain-containing protein [Bacillota bacterium]|nr:DUF488 domain-containing protein [Bacillota bacterium]
MGRICYTIGHSTRDINEFLEILIKNKINCIVDVRSTPYSASIYAASYNQNNIKSELKRHKINYIYMGDELGARRTDRNLYDEFDKVDFEKVKLCQEYKSGIDRIIDGIDKGYTIAVMCTEKDPIKCHRTILISYSLSKKGVNVIHLVDEHTCKNQNDIEEELLKLYESSLIKISFDDYLNNKENENEPDKIKQEMIEKAYRQKGKEISYRKEMDD